jgi:Eukaryotic porin
MFQMSVGAEYTMKQSTLHMSIDSGLLIKSSLSTTIAPGTELQLCAEMQQAGQHYKFGVGVMMG